LLIIQKNPKIKETENVAFVVIHDLPCV